MRKGLEFVRFTEAADKTSTHVFYYVLSNLLFDGAKVRLFFEIRIFWIEDGQILSICFHVASLSGRGT